MLGAPVSGVFEEIEGESEERRRLRFERHQRAKARMVMFSFSFSGLCYLRLSINCMVNSMVKEREMRQGELWNPYIRGY